VIGRTDDDDLDVGGLYCTCTYRSSSVDMDLNRVLDGGISKG